MSRLHLALPLAALMCASAASAADLPNKEALNEAIRSYILENPGVIVEALEKLERQEREAREKAAADALADRHDDIFNHPMTPVSGNKDGDITVVEFFDYQCGYCKRMLDRVFQIAEDDGNLRIVFKEFPILGPQSTTAARAALASREQGLYIEFHNALMGFQGQLADDVIFGLAREVGLDVDQLRADMDSDAVSAEIAANLELARSLDIRGTPAFVIGDNVVPGAVGLGVLQDMIEDVRSGSS